MISFVRCLDLKSTTNLQYVLILFGMGHKINGHTYTLQATICLDSTHVRTKVINKYQYIMRATDTESDAQCMLGMCSRQI